MFTPTPRPPFVPKSPIQVKKEYAETPYRLKDFWHGSQITITEERSMAQSMRYTEKISNKTNGKYQVYLVKITDGLYEKDLELFPTEYQDLMKVVPNEITNTKGLTFYNENGKWKYLCSDMPTPGTKPISQPASPEAQKDMFLKKMCEDMAQLNKVGISINAEVMLKIAESITPGDAMGLIAAAKTKGLIFEQAGVFKVT